MVFSEPLFLYVFLPVVVGMVALAPQRWANRVLLAASLLFYWWGSGGQVLLLLLSIGFNRWCISRVTRGDRSTARWWLIVDLVGNVAALGFFKYGQFIWDSVDRVLPTMPAAPIWLDVALPIGISFYTFQAMSAAVDVYRREAEVLARPGDFGLFIAFFPQLIAGPIVRYATFAPQLVDRQRSLDRTYAGLARFALGLAKKVLIADNAAVAADAVFSLSSPTTLEAWVGALAYTVQIYFDFSGYSDMAIGLGHVFGFELPENFRRPYSARTMTEFWQRWHITLSSWFRDYLYIPLGGSHGSSVQTYRNLAVVFFVTGLWHGAAWTFVVWGLLHGAILVVERATSSRFSDSYVRWAVTFVLVVLGWVVFRAETLEVAAAMVEVMTVAWEPGFSSVLAYDLTGRPLLAVAFGLASVALPRSVVFGVALTQDSATVWRAQTAVLVLVLPVTLLVAAGAGFSPFLYFQF